MREGKKKFDQIFSQKLEVFRSCVEKQSQATNVWENFLWVIKELQEALMVRIFFVEIVDGNSGERGLELISWLGSIPLWMAM